MSWKIRRAHYYSRQKYGGVDPEGAKFWNLIFLISLLFSFLFFVLAMGQADTDNAFVAIIGLLGLISLVTTPILFLFFLSNIGHGLPNLTNSPTKEKDFQKENLDKWLEDNKGKKIFNRAEAEKAA